MTATVLTPASLETDVLGHPRGLAYLSVSEGWERFSFLGMQSLLVLYMTHQLLLPGHVERVLGFSVLRPMIEGATGPLSATALASQVFGLYAGMVYVTPLIGGLLADRWVSRTKVVAAGAILMAIGHFLMAREETFLPALVLILAGCGGFNGNISSQVGSLYSPVDGRRATAFQVFQLGISTSAIAAPLVCGTLGEKVGWRYGFAVAGNGMLIGLAVYLKGVKWLPEQQARPSDRSAESGKLSARERKTVLLLIAMVPLLAATQVGNQQMFNAFVVWGEKNFDLWVAGFEMPVTWLLSADAAISVAMMMLSIWAWQACRKRGKEPQDIMKIVIGAAVMATAPLILSLASLQLAAGGKISIGWGVAFEFINEIGFVIIIPANLSLYSAAAPKRVQGLMLGVYLLSLFCANLSVGWLGALLEQMTSVRFWLLHAAIVSAAAIFLMAIAKWGRRLITPTDPTGTT
jgi:proton-dependent oligopeptide transporter, POT family